ncbi:MAG: response regulator [Acidobacteria bacterium]|nr:response regulator [Acidobacteriota bacterium]
MSANQTDRPAVILYVEENLRLWELVRDVLEFAGWYVKRFESCYGHAHIEGREHFDLLLIDRDLRNSADGLKLVRRARELPHRRETPIILISLADCADEARAAGADAFLRKPNNLIELVETIRRLLAASRA